MQENVSLIKALRNVIPPMPEVIIGRVISENPLTIQGEKDERLIMKNSLIIPKKFYDQPLKKNEFVHILCFNNKKSYYILDRAVI